MNTSGKTALLWLATCLFVGTAAAQDVYRTGMLPALNINKALSRDWSLNGQIESRQLFGQGVFGGFTERRYNYLLTDFSLMAAKSIGLNSRLAAGYMLRLGRFGPSHRLMQQYVLVQRMKGFRLAHRLRTDQTFFNEARPVFRLRYRVSSEIPLNGVSLDPNEFYLKLNHELLNSLQQGNYDLELRLVPLLGYNLAEKVKLELGFDYRYGALMQAAQRHSLWLSWNCFLVVGS